MIVWLAAATLLLTTSAWAAEQPVPARPEVLVLVSAAQNGTDRVSIAYAGAPGDAKARAEMQALLAATGWEARDVTVDTSRLAPGQPQATSVEFTTTAVVPYPGGVLPVAPLIHAYKQHRSLVFVFQPQRPYRFDGPASYQDRYLKIDLEQAPGSYRYNVVIADPSFTSLSLPNVVTEEHPSGSGRRRSTPPLALVLALALGAATSVGVVVYLVLAGRMGASSRPASPPGKRG